MNLITVEAGDFVAEGRRVDLQGMDADLMKKIISTGLVLLVSCGLCPGEENTVKLTGNAVLSNAVVKTAYAMFGAGCFWCSEAVFQRAPGVVKVESGYAGGHVKNPSYRDVCEGGTGHAEVIRVTYNPDVVGYEALLDLFWKAHDPTTLNRQGADVGTQYRSVIFYYSDTQKAVAEKSGKALDASGQYKSAVVTTLEKAGEFYPAEDYHQDYFNRNRLAPYCRMVIEPKLKKVGVGK